ncbi:MAG: CotH kinase family protein [Bacteroidota bacterium]|nr:CotH kinase family protein [Bacteroidota bacterium]
MRKLLLPILFCALIGLTFPIRVQSQNIFINEFLASNLTVNMDSDYYAFSDWIEIYNAESYSVNLGGYFISFDAGELQKWKIPDNTIIEAEGYLLFWADENNIKQESLHTNFTLQREGGIICLWNPISELLHSVNYSQQEVDISYGLNPQLNTDWMFSGNPTPGLANSLAGFHSSERASKPEFSINGGVYDHSMSIAISSLSPGATIFYTLDGSKPTIESSVYTGPLSVNSTTVIRAFTYEDLLLPSRTITHSYLINEAISLPIISISMNHEYFWDDEIGFYVEGTNGLTGWEAGYGPSPKSNFNQNWRRPMHIEFFDEDHQPGFSTEAQVKVYGGWSRGAVIKSLAIYPEPGFDYRLFKEKSFTKYESFIIRNSGNDWPSTKIRDATLQSLAINKFDVDLQANRPAVLFVNGEFWGVLNIREKINEDYVKTNHGVDQESIDFIESYRTIKAGDKIHYNNMMSFLANNSLSSPANYQHFKTLVDVEECMNYFITGIYSGHGDWIYNNNNNLRIWRPRTQDGIWRWLLYDTDGAFQTSSSRGIASALAYSTILSELMENEEARSYFINTFSALLNNAFAPERAFHMIDSLKLLIEPDVSRHIAKWKNTDEYGSLAEWKTPGAEGYIQIDDGYMGPCLDSYAQWESKFGSMRNVAQQRPPWLLNELKTVFNLGEQTEVKCRVSDTKAGIIELNNILVMDYEGSDYYFNGQTLHFEAIPKYGYKFIRWEMVNYQNTTIGLIDKNSEWKYLDNGSNQGTAWAGTVFNDLSWEQGFAELGYGDGGEATILSYGSNSSDKHITTYFRKEFIADNADQFEQLNLNIQRDDGAVVYINGNEVLRLNMPEGVINYQTTALSAVGGDDESAFFHFNIPAEHLVNGSNIIAVEIHQISPTSSDISFDLQLSGLIMNGLDSTIISTQKFDHELSGNTNLLAIFEPAEVSKSLFINEFMAKNINFSWPNEEGDGKDWIEIYNDGDQTENIGGLYITDDLTNPKLYRIPLSDLSATSVPPKGFIVLYADGKPELGVLHLNMELNFSGEQIGLVEEIAHEVVVHDSLSYQAQIMDVSFGRYLDGTNNRIYMETPSPGVPNLLFYNDLKTGLYINEFLTDNINDTIDNRGEHEDWIELYNSNDYPVSIAGLFITDDLQNPGRSRISSQYADSTLIQPKGYMILWADNDLKQGVRHLNFKLDQGGEQIGLYQFVGPHLSVIDSLSFSYSQSNYSNGRYPDAGTSWYNFQNTTPGNTNILVTSTKSIDSDSKIHLFPNPSTGFIHMEMDLESIFNDGALKISIYNVNGQLVVQKILSVDYRMNILSESFDLRAYSKGLYIVKIQTARELITRRIVIQ